MRSTSFDRKANVEDSHLLFRWSHIEIFAIRGVVRSFVEVMKASVSAPGQAGVIQPVQVRPGQGLSRPPVSECCVAAGNDGHEAYTATVWGVGLSHERPNNAGAETVGAVEGNMCGTAMRGADALPGSKATSRTEGSRWNLGDPAFDRDGVAALARIGKARSRSR